LRQLAALPLAPNACPSDETTGADSDDIPILGTREQGYRAGGAPDAVRFSPQRGRFELVG
jgi:hypothetical protein